jgi:hypothetical protein
MFEIFLFFLIFIFIICGSAIYIEMYNVIDGKPNSEHSRYDNTLTARRLDKYNNWQKYFIEKKYTSYNKGWFFGNIITLTVSFILIFGTIYGTAIAIRNTEKSLYILYLILAVLCIIMTSVAHISCKKGYEDKNFHNTYKTINTWDKNENETRFKTNYNYLIPGLVISIFLSLVIISNSSYKLYKLPS